MRIFSCPFAYVKLRFTSRISRIGFSDLDFTTQSVIAVYEALLKVGVNRTCLLMHIVNDNAPTKKMSSCINRTR
jgi:hypothetical protein